MSSNTESTDEAQGPEAGVDCGSARQRQTLLVFERKLLSNLFQPLKPFQQFLVLAEFNLEANDMYPTDYPGHVDIQATLQECAPHGGRARPLSATVCSASYTSHNSYYAESFLRQQIFSDFRFAYFAKFSPASKVLSKQSC